VVGVAVAGRALVRAGVACEQINDVCEQEGIQLPGMHGGITAAEINKRERPPKRRNSINRKHNL
jgi:hypothetical protein